jgi:hypothetical protein
MQKGCIALGFLCGTETKSKQLIFKKRIMKTTAKKLTTFGNLGLVQVRIENETGFQYRPAGPEIKNGGLIISESTGEGIVGKLLALNNTPSHLLLTDADVLVGAKQNRVLDKSILLAPMTKTVIDVSCIERLRWNYTSRNFSNPGSVANPDLRKEKARILFSKKNDDGEQKHETQRAVWSHVHESIMENGYQSNTESYAELIDHSMGRAAINFPACEPEKGCNGLAVILDRKVYSIDLFGNEEVFGYYFPMLRDSAFRMAVTGKKKKPVEQPEAYYKVLDALDNFEAAERYPESSYSGSGSFNNIETEEIVGFELTWSGNLIHDAIFAKLG